jgi:membrane protein
MRNLWTLGGLSVRELLVRTVQESWRDDVFGQGGRMAFYQFLAIFPSLFLCFAIGMHIPRLGAHFNDAFRDVDRLFFPTGVANLFESMLGEFNQHAHLGIRVLSILAGTVWATHNGTWAMIYGLNRAYEVEEHRSWWKLTVTIAALTCALVLAAALAVFLIVCDVGLQDRGRNAHLFVHPLEWLVLLIALLFCFALLFRFAPNLRDHQWRWSTPGTLFALLLWVLATLLARVYFDHVNDYSRSYGHLNGVVMLLLWLYLANGAILIGGELNSEIQKAETARGRSNSSAPHARDRSGN